ncbi:MAG TPA: HEAT repeat domain-containing protein [Chthonomonadaceae bacterium]|nr:HEAT repeat domain-containing protein [Chthonomonadaceae bacterium]
MDATDWAHLIRENLFSLEIGGLLIVVVWLVVTALLEEAAGPVCRWWKAHSAFADAEQTPCVRKCAERLASRRSATRIEAVRILGLLDDPTAVPALTRALERYDKDARFLEAAIPVLAQLGDARALPALRRLTTDHSYAVMQAARQAIAAIEPKSVLLRSSASPATISDTLLRPVSTSAPPAEPYILLRPGVSSAISPTSSES